MSHKKTVFNLHWYVYGWIVGNDYLIPRFVFFYENSIGHIGYIQISSSHGSCGVSIFIIYASMTVE